MARGLKSVNDEYKSKGSGGGSAWIKKLTIGDGEKAWFRYMATGEETDHRFESFGVHKEQGEEGRWTNEFCTMDETGLCKKCLTGKVSPQFGVWVWVDFVLRKKNNPALGKYDNAKPWPKVKYGLETFYKQEINDIRLYQSGPGSRRYIFNQILEAFQSFGTLMDRQYVISRTGTGPQDTLYSIKPTNETSGLTDKQVEIYRILPSIIAVASGKETWPPSDKTEPDDSDDDDVEVLSVPEPTPIMSSADDVVLLEEDEEEDIEEMPFEETIKTVAPPDEDLINDTIGKVMAEMEGGDSITPMRKGK